MLIKIRREYFDELEADFQQYYNLNIELVPNKRAARLLFQLPPNCRVFTKIQPAVQWGWSENLANKMVYLLETLVWMKTKDAQKKMPKNRPRMFRPDFMPPLSEPGEIAKDATVHDTDDIAEILARKRV